MSTRQIYAAVVAAARRRLGDRRSGRHLDIGAGRGELIEEFRRTTPFNSWACDFHVERFKLEDIEIRRVNLDREPLPFGDACFDLVTAVEVVEHLENFRAALREAYRVAAPGAIVVITTPNVLNAGSRARFVISGFARLFGPLPLRNDKLYGTDGHISMIPYFYLGHALLDAGFTSVECGIDKRQRSSMLWLALLAPLILLGRAPFFSGERRHATLTPANESLVRTHFSLDVLVGRTIVVSAVKPENAG